MYVNRKILNIDYDYSLKSLTRNNNRKNPIPIEPNMFIVGSLCLLQQFHPSAKLEYFGTLVVT